VGTNAAKSDSSVPDGSGRHPERQLQCYRRGRDKAMNNIFYIIGVVVVIVAILGFLGLR
jgi:hypothetical protein